MTVDEARQVVLELLQTRGKAKNSEMLQALGGDEALFDKVCEDLVFEGQAADVNSAGLRFKGAASTAESASCAAATTPGAVVFISYGRRDAKELADRLAVDLKVHGFSTWQDTRKITSGSRRPRLAAGRP